MLSLFTLSLGGIPISLIPDHISGEYEAVNRAVDFEVLDRPEISLYVHNNSFFNFTERTADYETVQGWQLFNLDEKSVIKVRDRSLDPTLVGVFSADFRSGDIYLYSHPETPHLFRFPLSYPMGELFTMNLLGTGLGMLFHGAGVIFDGKSYLFAGKSGAGKTTTSRLWQFLPGAKVVNDDKVIVRHQDGIFRLYGTPWHGEGGMALPDSAPLARVFFLKHGEQNSLNPLTPIQAAVELLGRSFIPLWDAEKMDFTLKFLDEMCQAVPCHELSFLPDSRVVDFVLNSD